MGMRKPAMSVALAVMLCISFSHSGCFQQAKYCFKAIFDL